MHTMPTMDGFIGFNVKDLGTLVDLRILELKCSSEFRDQVSKT